MQHVTEMRSGAINTCSAFVFDCFFIHCAPAHQIQTKNGDGEKKRKLRGAQPRQSPVQRLTLGMK